MPKLISEMTPSEFRLYQIQSRRERNAIARSRGFRNYAEMAGDND